MKILSLPTFYTAISVLMHLYPSIKKLQSYALRKSPGVGFEEHSSFVSTQLANNRKYS